jgi:hypothetical protein
MACRLNELRRTGRTVPNGKPLLGQTAPYYGISQALGYSVEAVVYNLCIRPFHIE